MQVFETQCNGTTKAKESHEKIIVLTDIQRSGHANGGVIAVPLKGIKVTCRTREQGKVSPAGL